MSLNQLKRYSEAITWYDKIVEKYPEEVGILTSKGSALSNLGKYDERMKCYNRALELNPDFAFAWNNKANLLDELGKQCSFMIKLSSWLLILPLLE